MKAFFLAQLIILELGLISSFIDVGLSSRKSYRLPSHKARKTLEDTKLLEFEKWLAKNKVRGNDCLVNIGPSESSEGLGLIVNSTLKAGQAVVTIPLTLCLNGNRVLKGKYGKKLSSFDSCLGDIGILAFQLILEKEKGEKSDIFPWLSLLPALEEMDLPLFWNNVDLNLADGSSTRCFSDFKEDVVDDYNWISANIFESDSFFTNSDIFSLDSFFWAVGCVVSRSFFVDGSLHLIPVVDFANHEDQEMAYEVDENVEVDNQVGTLPSTYRSLVQGLFSNISPMVDVTDFSKERKEVSRARTYLSREPYTCGLGVLGGKGIRLAASRDYQPGEEFLISYGPKGPAAYLEEYGFLPSGDGGIGIGGAEIQLELHSEKSDRFRDDKEDILSNQDLPFINAFDLLPFGTPDSKMIQYARLVCIQGMDAFLLEAVFRDEVWDFMSLPVSQSNEAAANNLIIDSCQAQLEHFCFSFEEDKQLLKDKNNLSTKQFLCLKLRIIERAALEYTIDFFTKDNSALERKEYYQTRRLRELNLDIPLDESEYTTGNAVSGRDAPRELDW